MVEFIGDLKLSKLPVKLSFEVLFEIERVNVLIWRQQLLFGSLFGNAALRGFDFGATDLFLVWGVCSLDHIGLLRQLAILHSSISHAQALYSSHYNQYYCLLLFISIRSKSQSKKIIIKPN